MNTFEFIEKHEGRKYRVYLDTAKPPKRTIGVGWNMDDNPLPPDIAAYLKDNGEITDEMIDRLLEKSVAYAYHDCYVLFPNFESFSDNRQMALTDFVFQVGFKKARGFKKSIAYINNKQWSEAAKEMLDSDWAKQAPNRAKEVTDMIKNG